MSKNTLQQSPTSHIQALLLLETELREALASVKEAQANLAEPPVKGVDYFTQEDKDELVEQIQAKIDGELTDIVGEILELLPEVKTPEKGIDYFTAEDIADLVLQVQSKVRNGETPVKGVDYFTSAEREALIKDVIGALPKVKPPKLPTIAEITAEVRKTPINYDEIENAPNRDEVTKLIEFLKRGGFRGGGASLSSVVGITYETVSGNLSANPYTISYNGTGDVSTIAYTTSTGTITKTINYNGSGDVSTIVLSGSTPAGIKLTKTLGYDGSGNVISVTYS